jgi:CDP-diacylglycerol--serine O-phosphatidyltransferase
MVTSGLVPGIIMFKLLTLTADVPAASTSLEGWNQTQWFPTDIPLIAYLGLLIPLASCYRLAKFNIDEDQQDSFIGLPTPANALLILSLPLILEFQNNDLINAVILNKWFLIVLTLVSTYLLNSKINLFALKFKDWSFKNNAMRYTFLILSVVLLVVLHFAAIPLIIALYILMSLLSNIS